MTLAVGSGLIKFAAFDQILVARLRVRALLLFDLRHILVDGKGITLYDFVKDKGTMSVCYGACAALWLLVPRTCLNPIPCPVTWQRVCLSPGLTSLNIEQHVRTCDLFAVKTL